MDKRTGSASQWRFCLTFFRILILLQPKSKPEMNKHMKKIIVITGASSGFGALTARALAKAGHTVYASIRETKGRNAPQVEEAKKFAKDNNVDLRTIELDVASQASADAAIQKIIADNKRLDVVIHNAGHMVFGPAEAFTPEQLAELYDVNVLSTQRVNRAALPQLRKQRRGLVVWVSRPQSLFLAPSPVARITSRMPGRPPTKREPPNTKRVLTKVSRTTCSRASLPSCLRMRMSRGSRTPSSKWSTPPLASDRSVCTMTRHRMERKSSMSSRTVSALSFFVGLDSGICLRHGI